MSYELQDFEKDVIERSRDTPVLVDFWAEWCGPCKMLTPVIEGLAEKAEGKWSLIKINTEEHAELAERFAIGSIPNVKLFYAGEVIDEFFGAKSEAEILDWLKEALPTTETEKLWEARRLLDAGDAPGAAVLAEAVHQADPDDVDARMLVAEAVLTSDPGRIAELLKSIGEASDYFDKAEALRRLATLCLAADAPDGLPEGKMRERYLDGAKAVTAGDYSAALEAFIEVIERQRDYAKEGAKEACKAIFQLLGIRHATVEKHYRAFTSALYS
ncbi:MAG: putative thioredoxin [Limisphaerales bacterium]|jgi:putative thioredoxin